MKGLARAFEKSRFGSPDEVKAFLAEVDEVPKAELLKCWEYLLKAWGTLPSAHYRLSSLLFVELAKRGAHRSLFVPLVRGLKTPNPFVVEVLERVLPLVNSPKEHRELCALLADENKAVRRASLDLVEKLFHADTVEPLLKLCKTRGFAGFDEVLELAVRLRRPELLPALEDALERGPPPVRDQAVSLLAEPAMVGVPAASAVGVLVRLLRSDDHKLAATALAGLGALTTEDFYLRYAEPFLDDGSLERIEGALRGLAHHRSPRVFQIFEDKLAEGPTDIRLCVLSLLEQISSDDVLPPLVAALSLDDLKVQGEAVRVLRSLTGAGEVDIVRTLLWLLRSPEVQVRRLASEVIDAIPDPNQTTWPRLLEFLRDEDWWVRERVLDALIQIAGRALTRYLAALLEDPSRTVRRLAVEGMAKLEDPEAIGVLVRTAGEDEDWWVREAAVQAIGKLHDERAVPYVLRFLESDPEIAVACIDTLTDLGAKGATPQVTAFLDAFVEQGTVDATLAALRFLERVEDGDERRELVPKVQHLMKSDDPEVVAAARDVLEAWSVQLVARPETDDDAGAILDAYLATLVTEGGDDLIFSSGQRVYMKRRGEVVPLTDVPLTAENVFLILSAITKAQHLDELSRLHDVDLSHRSAAVDARFRVNVFQAQHGLGAVFRKISDDIPDFQNLGLPPIVGGFSRWPHGLVLIGGPPGSGKSTTLTALLAELNKTEARHIITVEDPIEAVHTSSRSLINQREVGAHTSSFGHALRSILRQDPDVILIGELRDFETVEFALRAAETGHLVFGTVHTFAADTTVDRLVNSFPTDRRDHARGMLADSLRAVLCQFLLPDVMTGGRVIAAEILINNEAVANVIRKNQAYQIPSLIQLGAEHGQQSMDAALAHLFRHGRIDEGHLRLRLRNKELFDEIVKPTDGSAGAAGPHRGGES